MTGVGVLCECCCHCCLLAVRSGEYSFTDFVVLWATGLDEHLLFW